MISDPVRYQLKTWGMTANTLQKENLAPVQLVFLQLLCDSVPYSHWRHLMLFLVLSYSQHPTPTSNLVRSEPAALDHLLQKERLFIFLYFPHFFQAVLSSAEITVTVTFSGSSVAFGVPRDGLSELVHKNCCKDSQENVSPVTAAANSICLQRSSPGTSANTGLDGEMDFVAKALFTVSQPVKQTRWGFSSNPGPRRLWFLCPVIFVSAQI